MRRAVIYSARGVANGTTFISPTHTTTTRYAGSTPAWAEESRRKHAEELRRREARKRLIAEETADNKPAEEEEDDDDCHHVANPSDALPVVQSDGWLLFQNHDAYSASTVESWSPAEDEVGGAGLRSLEQAKFHCEKMGYGGFVQRFSLMYHFRAHTPRRLVAAREHCAKQDTGMLHLYVNPNVNNVKTLHGNLLQRYNDAVENGETPIEKDDLPDFDDDLDAFGDDNKDGEVRAAEENMLDDDWLSDLNAAAEKGEKEDKSSTEERTKDTPRGELEKQKDNIETEVKQEVATPMQAIKVEDEGKVAGVKEEEEGGGSVAPPTVLSPMTPVKTVSDIRVCVFIGTKKNAVGNYSNVSGDCFYSPQGSGIVFPLKHDGKSEKSQGSEAVFSLSTLGFFFCQQNNNTSQVKGVVAVEKGTEGIVVGPGSSGGGRVHVKFASRVDGGYATFIIFPPKISFIYPQKPEPECALQGNHFSCIEGFGGDIA